MELVQVDSVSGQERKLADLLLDRLESLGLEVWEDDAGKKLNTSAGNIIGKLPKTVAGGEPVLLCAHMDTVEPGVGVVPVLDNRVIKSSGDTILGADDKAGITAILEVLRVIRENNIPHGGIEVAFTVWEEGGLLGAKNLDFDRLESKMGFVLDCDGPAGTIIVQAPSQDRISATVRGRAAHAGISPEEGINAIVVASRAIAAMKLGRIDDETTANIGVITGGKAINIVPDAVTIKGETRSLTASKREAQTKAMVAALEETARANGTTADVVVETIYPDFKLGEKNRVVIIAARAARQLGMNPRLVKTGGGSDANIFNNRGIAVANLGIAMQKVHTTDEYIRSEDLVSNARYLLEIISTVQETA
ncbi:MAG: peptidase M20 [Peptococcaceae bacterium BRH_c4b]|nr:MAG: peptidase M20 [Peptococcaceae bacterium BRH_c4b]